MQNEWQIRAWITNELKIEEMLLELPDVVRQFYNNIRVSKSSKTCIDYIRYIQNLIEHSGKSAAEEITDIDI